MRSVALFYAVAIGVMCHCRAGELPAPAAQLSHAKDVVPGDPGWGVGPTIVEREPGGEVLMVWTGGKPGSGEDAKVGLWKSTSRDAGRTWTKAEPFLSDARRGLFNPVGARLADGSIVLFYDPYEYPYKESICLIRSADKGRTWSAPETIRTGHAYTTTRGPVVQLRDGKVVLPFCWEESISVDGNKPELWNGSCMISDDSGKTWTKGGDMPHWGRPRGAQEPTIVETKDGGLFCLLRTNEGRLFQSVSRDAGRTWSKASPSAFASPCACAVLQRLKSGRVLLVWNNVASKTNEPRSPLTAAWSDDDGATWHAKDLAKSDTTPLSNHSVLQLASGEILVAVASGHPVEILRFNELWLESGTVSVIKNDPAR